MKGYIVSCLSLLAVLSSADSTFSPARPPSIPLAVKSPYLSTWQQAGSDGGNGGYLYNQWPSFWTGDITAWTGFIRVDGHPYTWMGAPESAPPTVEQTDFHYTSTRSVFTLDVAGKVQMNITFMSPVTPDDEKRMSMPFSYLIVDVASMDGKTHNVQLYTDVSAEWASGDRNEKVQWDYGVVSGTSKRSSSRRSIHAKRDHVTTQHATAGGVAYHKFYRQNQAEFQEFGNQASWGHWYYSTANTNGLTHQSGSDSSVRNQFTKSGVLKNSEDTQFRAINNDYPVFGFAKDLGSVGSQPAQTVFTINIAQKNSIRFSTSKTKTENVPSLWNSYFKDELAALSFFYNDASMVASMCTALDRKIVSDSHAAGGNDYVVMTTLAVRQAWGAMALVGNKETQYMFLKEISSDGDIETVDVIFPMFPMLMYMKPSYIKLLLNPLFINQEADIEPPSVTYALHDLGFYPNAVGFPDPNHTPEAQPLEECGNMLIMALAYAQKTSDTEYLNQHYDLLKQWTKYLVDDSLTPQSQISTDDFAGPLVNQTNLAVKGMIGIEAMAKIAHLTGHNSDASKYTSIARDYIKQWQTLGFNHQATPPHSTLNYGNQDSWGTLYNIYADSLLETKLVPKSVYQMQSNYYPHVMLEYGLPLDSRHAYSKSDWAMFAAAVADTKTRSAIIHDIAMWIGKTPTNGPVTDLYSAQTGDWPTAAGHFMARPVVGGWFSLLALNHTGIPN